MTEPLDNGQMHNAVASIRRLLAQQDSDAPQISLNPTVVARLLATLGADRKRLALLEEVVKAAREMDRLSLVFESAVRNCDTPNHGMVVDAVKANRAALAALGDKDADNG